MTGASFDWLKLFDRYDLLARIIPGALAPLVPTIALAVGAPRFITSDLKTLAGYSFISIAAMFVFAQSARANGRRVQKRLTDRWGGMPTELLLAWKDQTIEVTTKRAYHRALQKLATDITLPDMEQESRDLSGALGLYRSAVRRLIEMRRGPTYRLILNDNIAYGFWRNMLGMRPTALIASLISSVMLLIFLHDGLTTFPNALPSFFLTGVWVLFQCTVIGEKKVWDAGVAYAERLLSSLHLGPVPRRSRKKASELDAPTS
ncbi:hypothetical protein [Acidocella sp.]|uniref:hypothetical protein n=1 Tax=Acidocella sp. TaxID=50710 RepID=UPI003D079215